MEKKLLLFFVLSFLFLMIWGKMNPSSTFSPDQRKPDAQLSERQEDVEQPLKATPLKQEAPSVFESKQIKEENLKKAIELSHERYCSALHSLRPDINFVTNYQIEEA